MNLLRLGLCFVCLLSFAAADELWESERGRERVFSALVDVFQDHYWDPDYRDWSAWAQNYHDEAVGASSRSGFENALGKMVRDLQDDHSRFVGIGSAPLPSLDDEEPDPVGVGFRHTYLSGLGLVVERVFPGTPAADAGLRRGDLVSHINTRALRDLGGPFEADRLLRDAITQGEVTLRVRRKSDSLRLSVAPAPVDFERAANTPQGEMLDETTAYLYLPSFKDEGTAAEVHALLGELVEQGATSLVLDLRDNLGGRLGELGLVLGAFIEGTWVEAISRDDIIWRSSYQTDEGSGVNVLEDTDGDPFAGDTLSAPVHFGGPVAVIVSRRNSSAGEVAALVLQEQERATIVGEPTLGNVEAIQSFDLPDGSLVYVAVANLQGSSGVDYSGGVVPDTEVSTDSRDLARGFDAPLAEALKALKNLPFTPGKFF